MVCSRTEENVPFPFYMLNSISLVNVITLNHYEIIRDNYFQVVNTVIYLKKGAVILNAMTQYFENDQW